jgi:prepilin-type N-terminal cleavage/methylation domain-containing protein
MRIPFSNRRGGFTLIEILVVVGIIGVLATIVTVASTSALAKARDAKRKDALTQMGRLLAGSGCYMPDGGANDYDIGDLYAEVIAKNPQYAQFVSSVPKDPRGGTFAVTKYRYVVKQDGSGCVLYANLENGSEPVTIPDVIAPTAGAGAGVFKSSAAGPNGSDKYFQVSNK